MSTADNATTTNLNPGVGGDSMNESLITQADGQTQAKSPRVVLQLDDGTLVSMKGPLPVSLQSDDRQIFLDIRDSLRQLVALTGGIPNG